MIRKNPELTAKFKRALDKLRTTLPTEDGKFTPDLKQVRLNYLQEDASREGEGEFARFVAGDSSQFSTYGMTEEEKRGATLKYNAEKDCLVDSEGKKPDSGRFLYNITREGELVVVLDSREDFHHSSITRDGAIICAGYLEIKDGKINYIDTNSGHYTPEDLDLYNAIKALKKQSPNIFKETATIESYQSGQKPLNEFVTFMEEPTLSRSRMIPRAEIQRSERIEEHLNIARKTEKVKFLLDASLEESILSTNLSTCFKEEKQYLFTFPKELFEPEYVSSYATKTLGKENQEEKLTSVSLTSIELLEYLSKTPEKSANAIKHLINNGISKDKNFQKGIMNISEYPGLFKPLTEYHIKNPSEYSTIMLKELTYAIRDKEITRKIADHLLKPENIEQTRAIIPLGYPQARLIGSASPDTQTNVIDRLMQNKGEPSSQEILITLSENKNTPSEKRAEIIREICIKPKLEELIERTLRTNGITE